MSWESVGRYSSVEYELTETKEHIILNEIKIRGKKFMKFFHWHTYLISRLNTLFLLSLKENKVQK